MLATILAAAGIGGAAAPVAVDYEIGVVGDYRFRGVSLSDRRPAVQAGAQANFASGAYVGVWGSTIDEYASEGDPHGATVELDVNVGWIFKAGGLDVDAGLGAYTYPGARSLAYVEFPLSLSREVGSATLTVSGAYAPKQSALDRDNIYVAGSVDWRIGEYGLAVQSGYEDGEFAPSGKWDWSAGLTRHFGPVRAEFNYVDGDGPDTPPGVVAGLAVEF